MDEDKFTLAWNDFASNAANAFVGLRKDSEFSDVTLACSDLTMIKAHKVVLASCSPVFRKLFQQYNHPNPLIIMRGLNKNQLENIIDYAYFGQIEVELPDLDTYLKVAEEFKLKGLTDLGTLEDNTTQDGKDTTDKINETKGHEDLNSSFVKNHPENLINIDKTGEEIKEKVSNNNYNEHEQIRHSSDETKEVKSSEKFKLAKNEMDESFTSNRDDREYLPLKSDSFKKLQELINSKIVKLNDPNLSNDYKCSDCGKEFSSKNKTSLKCHIEAFHIAPFQDMKLECPLCQKIFNRTRPYTNHSKVCANQD